MRLTKTQRYAIKQEMNNLKNLTENKDMLKVNYVIYSKNYKSKYYFFCPFKAIHFLNLSKILYYKYNIHGVIYKYDINREPTYRVRTSLVKDKYCNSDVKTYGDCFELYTCTHNVIYDNSTISNI